ncbi:tRNA (uracil-5-)-methyltransferase homolog B-like isoform X2 [Liolophura sinensis]
MKYCISKVIDIGLNSRPRKSIGLLQKLSQMYDGQCCPLEDIKPAPVIYGYRNKEEFNVGCNIHGNPNTVGLYVGKERHRNAVCVEPDQLINMSARHIEVCKVFQDFVRSCRLPVSPLLQERGHWRNLIIRSTTLGQLMAVVKFNPRHLSEEDIELAENELRDYFASGPGKSANLSSLYFQACPHTFGLGTDFPYKHLLGAAHIEEEVLDMRFNISADSFFQTNTPGAEVLYSTVREYASLSPDSTVFDVYCGTGTIGILLSPTAKKVIGIEMLHQAVEDAKVNAHINGCSNTQFIQGDARKLMNQLFMSGQYDGEDLVAIVNPGRTGLSKKGVRALKRCSAIRRLVFVTCKPHGKVLQNMVDLSIEMDDIATDPFCPVKSVAVDMFPHTLHTELVTLYER